MGFDGDKYRDLPCPTNMGISIGITLCWFKIVMENDQL
jgi:hypothetical protein